MSHLDLPDGGHLKFCLSPAHIGLFPHLFPASPCSVTSLWGSFQAPSFSPLPQTVLNFYFEKRSAPLPQSCVPLQALSTPQLPSPADFFEGERDFTFTSQSPMLSPTNGSQCNCSSPRQHDHPITKSSGWSASSSQLSPTVTPCTHLSSSCSFTTSYPLSVSFAGSWWLFSSFFGLLNMNNVP